MVDPEIITAMIYWTLIMHQTLLQVLYMYHSSSKPFYDRFYYSKTQNNMNSNLTQLLTANRERKLIVAGKSSKTNWQTALFLGSSIATKNYSQPYILSRWCIPALPFTAVKPWLNYYISKCLHFIIRKNRNNPREKKACTYTKICSSFMVNKQVVKHQQWST